MRLRKGFAHAALFALSACAQTPITQPSDEADTATPKKDELDLALTASEETFTAFESGQVRPLALSANGKYLYAVNTPDNRLEIFATGAVLTPLGSVRVGLEPVAVNVAPNGDVWVVNHLSDSVSIVNVSAPAFPFVKRTLLVGDEPRDVVFAGGSTKRAFITTAHRGQNTGRDPQLSTPGVGRADVWVFDAASQGDTLAGTPVTVLTLFADTPRALTVSPDGATVYAAAFKSGNQTTVLHERVVTNYDVDPLRPGINGGMLPPFTDVHGSEAPFPSLIVKYRFGLPDGQKHWLDELNRNWDSKVRFNLPDKDVFAIDATLATPALKTGPGAVSASVGTVLFNMAVNPVSKKVYVSNLESRNEVRFEGHNDFGGNGSVRGHIAESRITVINGANVTPIHLNKHLDALRDEDNPPTTAAANSLAFPTGMAVSSDGATLLVAALGSSKLGIFKTTELENNTFVPSSANHVKLTGGGPTGVVMSGKTAYVFTRFDNGISMVNTTTKKETSHTKLYNPEPASITKGRRFLYDAAFTSSLGDSACASCHIFGDLDDLSWDLGDPDGDTINNPGPFTIFSPVFNAPKDFHPMKGPMATQSLRGMANHGPMHWRGDRTGGNDVPESVQPDTGIYDEEAAFKAFNPAFEGLLGNATQLSEADMQAFTDFILQVTYPPNPIRNLDNSLTADQQVGRNVYFQPIPVDTFFNCNGCHLLDPQGNEEFGVKKPGFFGADGRSSFEVSPQFMKVPHMRNAYTKVGMFGMAQTALLPIDTTTPSPTNPAGLGRAFFLPPPLNDESHQGDQIRGFGFLHDGAVDTLYRFLGGSVFLQRGLDSPFPNPGGFAPNLSGITIRKQVESFVMAFDTNLAPIVGQQVTLTSTNGVVADPRIALLKQRAAAGECDLVVTGWAVRELGFLYLPETDNYQSDVSVLPPITETTLRKLVTDPKLIKVTRGAPLTFLAVPPGTGERIALDRNCDSKLDAAALPVSL